MRGDCARESLILTPGARRQVERKGAAVLVVAALHDDTLADQARQPALNGGDRTDVEQVQQLQRQRLTAYDIVISDLGGDVAIFQRVDERQVKPFERMRLRKSAKIFIDLALWA